MREPTGPRPAPPSSLLCLELAQPPVLAEIQAIHLQTRKTDDKQVVKGLHAGKEEAVEISDQGEHLRIS